jgi:hypothetical protein
LNERIPYSFRRVGLTSAYGLDLTQKRQRDESRLDFTLASDCAACSSGVKQGSHCHALCCACRPLNFTILSSMTPEQKADKLDAELKDQEVAMAQLQSKVGENKEASEELNKSLQKLDAVTEKVEGEKG